MYCPNSINHDQVISYLSVVGTEKHFLNKCLYLLGHMSCWTIQSEFLELKNLMSPSHEVLFTTIMHNFVLPKLIQQFFKYFFLHICISKANLHWTLPEKSWCIHQPKPCEYNNEDEDNNPNTPSDKNIYYYRSIKNVCSGTLIGLVLWHINHCRLFNAKSGLFIYIRYMICEHKSRKLKSSKYCNISIIIQLNISHLFTHS